MRGGSAREVALLTSSHDRQSSQAAWSLIGDNGNLHPYVQKKLQLLLQLPAVEERASSSVAASIRRSVPLGGSHFHEMTLGLIMAICAALRYRVRWTWNMTWRRVQVHRKASSELL